MLITFAAALALAADPAPPSAADAIETCRKVEGDASRLACFDRAAAAFAEARAKKDLVVMDRAEVRRTKRSLFGFSLPSFNLFGGGDDDDADAIKELNAKIGSAAPFGYGYYTLTLDDGTEWQTTDRSPSFTPRRGDPIKIKHTSLGYRATSLGGLVAVRRVK